MEKSLTRIERKKWPVEKYGILDSSNIRDAFDNHIKLAYRITDAEYDHIAERMTDDEVTLFVQERPTFSQKRQMIILLRKYLN